MKAATAGGKPAEQHPAAAGTSCCQQPACVAACMRPPAQDRRSGTQRHERIYKNKTAKQTQARRAPVAGQVVEPGDGEAALGAGQEELLLPAHEHVGVPGQRCGGRARGSRQGGREQEPGGEASRKRQGDSRGTGAWGAGGQADAHASAQASCLHSKPVCSPARLPGALPCPRMPCVEATPAGLRH